MKGLQGSLEERARLALEMQEENKRLKEELDELKLQLKTEKEAKNELQVRDSYLEEKVEVLKQLLEQENEEKDSLEKELEEYKTKLTARDTEYDNEKKKASALGESKLSLEEQVSSLQAMVLDLTNKLKSESDGRQKRERHS